MGHPIWFEAADVPDATVTVTSEQPDSPALRLVTAAPKWERPWRATSAVEQTGTVTFTDGAQDIVGFVAYHANFTTLIVNGVTYTIQAGLDGRRSLFKAVSFTADEVDFEIPVQTITDQLPYFKLGRLLFLTAFRENEEAPGSITREIIDPQVTAESALGVFDTLPAGSPYSRETWTGQYTGDTLPNIRAMYNRRAHEWVGKFRNLNTTRDYEFEFATKEGSTRINYGNITVDIEVSWRQQL